MTLAIGNNVPRSGNALTRWIGRSVLRLLGWRLAGSIPDAPKMVWLGGPHTSNMDGVIAIATLVALGVKANTMIKDSAFKGVLGPILRGFGAIPINRRSPKGVVEQSIEAFDTRDAFVLLIAPEGTRYAAKEWKRGYWHIALGAKALVMPVACDYQRKIITVGPAFAPSGDYAQDFEKMLDFYAASGVARHPERLSNPLCDRAGQTWKPQARE